MANPLTYVRFTSTVDSDRVVTVTMVMVAAMTGDVMINKAVTY